MAEEIHYGGLLARVSAVIYEPSMPVKLYMGCAY